MKGARTETPQWLLDEQRAAQQQLATVEVPADQGRERAPIPVFWGGGPHITRIGERPDGF